jgi:ankyrin repeat protein
MLAVISGDLPTVQALAERALTSTQVPPRIVSSHLDCDNWNIMHAAACFGHAGIIEWLASHVSTHYGADELTDLLNGKDVRGLTPLCIASENSHWLAAIRLLRASSLPHSCTTQPLPSQRQTPTPEMLGLPDLSVGNSNVAATTTKQAIHSPLHALVMNPHLEIEVAEPIMEQLCQLTDTNAVAIDTGHADCNVDHHHGTSTLRLGRASRISPCTPLHLVAKYSPHASLAAILIKYSANVNAVDANLLTPLHMTAHNIAHGKDIAQVLCRNGANSFALSRLHNMSPLHGAAQEMNFALVRFLATHTPDLVTIVNRQGNTALHIVCSSNEFLTSRTLDAASAAAKAPHERPQSYSIAMPNLVAPAPSSAADICFGSRPSIPPEDYIRLLQQHHQSQATSHQGSVAQQMLAQHHQQQSEQQQQQELASAREEQPTDFDTRMPFQTQSFGGITNSFAVFSEYCSPSSLLSSPSPSPSQHASTSNNASPMRSAVESLSNPLVEGEEEALVRFLLEQPNANVNAKNSFSETPLHCACRRGKLKVCKVLVENGADIGALDSDRITPAIYAAKRKSIALFQYLVTAYEAPEDQKRAAQATDLLGTSYLLGCLSCIA